MENNNKRGYRGGSSSSRGGSPGARTNSSQRTAQRTPSAQKTVNRSSAGTARSSSSQRSASTARVRKGNANTGRNSGARKKTGSTSFLSGITPLIAAVIAAAIVIVVCVPLVIIAISRNNEAANAVHERVFSAKELGITPAEPEMQELALPEETGENANSGENTGTALYKRGDTDEKMKDIQKRLMDLGYMITSDTTTLFGPATEDAVKLFQTRNGLNSSGVIDQKTYDAMFAENAEKFMLTVGSSGSDVANMQSRLKQLGYFDGTATGYFGSETESAVRNFQSQNGLSADGKVGIKTYKLISSSEAKKAGA